LNKIFEANNLELLNANFKGMGMRNFISNIGIKLQAGQQRERIFFIKIQIIYIRKIFLYFVQNVSAQLEPSSGRQYTRDNTGVESHTLKKFTYASFYAHQDCVLRPSSVPEKIGRK